MDKELAMNTLEELVSDGNAPPEVVQELLDIVMNDNESNMEFIPIRFIISNILELIFFNILLISVILFSFKSLKKF